MLILFGIILAGVGLILWELCPRAIPTSFLPLLQLSVFLGIVTSIIGFILAAWSKL